MNDELDIFTKINCEGPFIYKRILLSNAISCTLTIDECNLYKIYLELLRSSDNIYPDIINGDHKLFDSEIVTKLFTYYIMERYNSNDWYLEEIQSIYRNNSTVNNVTHVYFDATCILRPVSKEAAVFCGLLA
jgi:hypothetical protein